MPNFIKKINTRVIDIRNENIEVFNIEMDGIEFGSRVFEWLQKSSPNGRFVVLIERKITLGKVLENSRCVLIDVNLKKQWVGAWNLWHKYTIEEFSEVEQNKNSKWSFKKLYNTLFNIEGFFVYKTKRMSSMFPEIRKKIFLPITSEKQFTEYSAISSINIESLADGKKILFDSFKISYFERDYQIDVNWSSVTKITFQKRYFEQAEWNEIKLYGSTHLSVSLPCLGVEDFITELNNRYKITREQVIRLYESETDSEDLVNVMWSTDSEKIAIISFEHDKQFKKDFFYQGFLLESGKILPWALTFKEIKSSELFKKGKKNDYPVYHLNQNVWVGPILVTGLYFYENSIKGDEWIVESWYFDFSKLSPELNDIKLKSLLLPLSSSDSTWFELKPFNCHIFNDDVLLSLDGKNGGWSGFINPSFESYWSTMREIHPMVKKIKISEFISFEASTSLVSAGIFRIEGEIKEIPNQKEFCIKPLIFWKDKKQMFEGLSCYNTSFFWESGDLINIELEVKSFPGERGMDDYTTEVLYIILKGKRKITFDFNFIDSFDVEKVKNWYLIN